MSRHRNIKYEIAECEYYDGHDGEGEEGEEDDGQERRIDMNDGGAYTRDEFVEFYGGLVQWDNAKVYHPKNKQAAKKKGGGKKKKNASNSSQKPPAAKVTSSSVVRSEHGGSKSSDVPPLTAAVPSLVETAKDAHVSCPVCTYENPAGSEECLMCGTALPSPVAQNAPLPPSPPAATTERSMSQGGDAPGTGGNGSKTRNEKAASEKLEGGQEERVEEKYEEYRPERHPDLDLAMAYFLRRGGVEEPDYAAGVLAEEAVLLDDLRDLTEEDLLDVGLHPRLGIQIRKACFAPTADRAAHGDGAEDLLGEEEGQKRFVDAVAAARVEAEGATTASTALRSQSSSSAGNSSSSSSTVAVPSQCDDLPQSASTSTAPLRPMGAQTNKDRGWKRPVRASGALDSGSIAEKTRLSMVVVGHVDAGKSTLMGQLLVATGRVSQRVVHKYKKEAAAAGKGSFYLAWLTDEGSDERSHGVTIEVASKQCETATKAITILDAPGHADFVPAMIGGAMQADVALLVVAASPGEFESGFSKGGQTKEHAMLLKSLGVNQVLVAINKLDTTTPTPFSRARFDDIVQQIGAFLVKECSFKPHLVRFVPVSAFYGHNVSSSPVAKSGVEACPLVEWGVSSFAELSSSQPDQTVVGRENSGGSSGHESSQMSSSRNCSRGSSGSLVDAIDAFRVPPRATAKPLRALVADAQPGPRGTVIVSAQVCQGTLDQGQPLLLMPWGDRAVAAKLHDGDSGGSLAHCEAGDVAGSALQITLAGNDVLDDRIHEGDVLCSHPAIQSLAETETPVKAVKKFVARISTFSALKVPLIEGTMVQLHVGHAEVAASVSRLVSLLDRTGAVKKAKPRAIPANSASVIKIKTKKAGVTVAAGLITELA